MTVVVIGGRINGSGGGVRMDNAGGGGHVNDAGGRWSRGSLSLSSLVVVAMWTTQVVGVVATLTALVGGLSPLSQVVGWWWWCGHRHGWWPRR